MRLSLLAFFSLVFQTSCNKKSGVEKRPEKLNNVISLICVSSCEDGERTGRRGDDDEGCFDFCSCLSRPKKRSQGEKRTLDNFFRFLETPSLCSLESSCVNAEGTGRERDAEELFLLLLSLSTKRRNEERSSLDHFFRNADANDEKREILSSSLSFFPNTNHNVLPQRSQRGRRDAHQLARGPGADRRCAGEERKRGEEEKEKEKEKKRKRRR